MSTTPTTRRALLGAMGATGIGLLAGCGTSSDSVGSKSAETTRTVRDYSGDVTVPAHPQRVVAAEGTTFGHIASLGVTPLAAAVNENSIPHYQAAQLKGTHLINTDNWQMDLEKALALNPDLILTVVGSPGDMFNLKTYQKYKKATTTFGYMYGFAYIEEIEGALKSVASALNLEAKAEDMIKKYDARVAELKQRVVKGKLTDKPVTTLRIGKGWLSIRMGSAESIAFRALGMMQPKEQRDVKKFSIDLSLEKLDIVNEAETLFVYTDDNAAADNKKIMDSQIWKRLKPVQDHRVVEVNSGVWNGMDMQGMMIILDDIEKGFIAAHGA